MAGKGGRKEKRESKLRDIMQDDSGKMVYTGGMYRIEDDGGFGSARRQRLLLIGGLFFLGMVIIGSGCIDAKNATGSFYVVLPYIGEVSALFALLWNGAKLLAHSDGVRSYVLEKCRSTIPAACRVLMVFAAAGFILSAVYAARNGLGDAKADGIAYLMLKIAAAAAAEWYRRLFISTGWIKNDI